MSDQKEEQKNQHPQEHLLEAVVINCQHIAAICKGLCVKGVSYDVSVKELERHKELTNSDSTRVLKEECLRCQSVLSDCVIKLDALKRQYLADYNKNEDADSKQPVESAPVQQPEAQSDEQTEAQSEQPADTEQQTGEASSSTPETKTVGRKQKKLNP